MSDALSAAHASKEISDAVEEQQQGQCKECEKTFSTEEMTPVRRDRSGNVYKWICKPCNSLLSKLARIKTGQAAKFESRTERQAFFSGALGADTEALARLVKNRELQTVRESEDTESKSVCRYYTQGELENMARFHGPSGQAALAHLLKQEVLVKVCPVTQQKRWPLPEETETYSKTSASFRESQDEVAGERAAKKAKAAPKSKNDMPPPPRKPKKKVALAKGLLKKCGEAVVKMDATLLEMATMLSQAEDEGLKDFFSPKNIERMQATMKNVDQWKREIEAAMTADPPPDKAEINKLTAGGADGLKELRAALDLANRAALGGRRTCMDKVRRSSLQILLAEISGHSYVGNSCLG
jgi:hypothetical protein